MRNSIHTYRDLNVWAEGMELVPKVYDATSSYPEEERFGLTSQTRRAAVSIPANIAEGWARPHRREYAQFVGIALGSIAELQTLLQLGKMLGFIEESNSGQLSEEAEKVRAKLVRLHGSMKAG